LTNFCDIVWADGAVCLPASQDLQHAAMHVADNVFFPDDNLSVHSMSITRGGRVLRHTDIHVMR